MSSATFAQAEPGEEPLTGQRAPRAFHVMAKPTGPICNLDCRYCFYLEKENLYAKKRNWAIE